MAVLIEEQEPNWKSMFGETEMAFLTEETEPNWKLMFMGLCNYLAREAMRNADPLSDRSIRADAYLRAHAYAEGVASVYGVTIPQPEDVRRSDESAG